MYSILTHTLLALSRLIQAVRCACSLRHLALLLPVGTPAPRLPIQIPPQTDGRFGHSQDYCLSTSYETDHLYTSTSSFTEIDEEPVIGRRPLAMKKFHLYSSDASSVDVDPSPMYKRKLWKNSNAHRVPAVGHRFNGPMNKGGKFDPAIRKRSHLRGAKYSSTDSLNGTAFDNGRPHVLPRSRTTDTQLSESDASAYSLGRPRDVERINHLEQELALLRAQLARLVVMQEGRQVLIPSAEEFDQRLEADGESDAAIPVCQADKQLVQPMLNLDPEPSSVEKSIPIETTVPCPPVPIPPPPPLILMQNKLNLDARKDWRAELIAKRKAKCGDSAGPLTPSASTPQSTDMNQVLRELQSGSVKLRSVPRSPGGTPIRTAHKPNDEAMDPAAIITRALRTKFSRVRAVLDLSTSGGENNLEVSVLDTSDHESSHVRVNHPGNKHEHHATDRPFGPHLLRPTHKSAIMGRPPLP